MNIFLITLSIVLLTYFYPYILRFLVQIWQKKYCRKNGVIVLTFDDGPNNKMTPLLLDLLESKNAKATFFILGNKLNNNKKIVFKILSNGHDIGCHSYSHLNAWKVNPISAIKDIHKGFVSLLDIDILCKIYRAPFGKINIFTFIYTYYKNAKNCWWTIESGDTFYKLPSPKEIVIKLKKCGGGIVLMHDFHETKERRDFVLETTSLIIDFANKNNLKIKTMSEILQ